MIPGKSTVILYAGAEKPNTMYTVPQLVGKTAAEANVAATNAGSWCGSAAPRRPPPATSGSSARAWRPGSRCPPAR